MKYTLVVLTHKHSFYLGACAEGFIQHGSSCYFFNDLESDRMTWTGAYETCKSVGAYLVVINGEGEDKFIRDHLGSDSEMWIGLYSKYALLSLYNINIIYILLSFLT